MRIRESALNTIASLANGDFVRMVTAAGASRKASMQTIAQHILETYTGTSLAGSNQSVKAAIDGLNSTTVAITPASTNISDMSNFSYKSGKTAVISIYFKVTGAIAAGDIIATANVAPPTGRINAPMFRSNVFIGGVYLLNNGNIVANVPMSANNAWVFVTIPVVTV